MSSQGPNAPGTMSTFNSGGSPDWVNPGNATASDDVYATATYVGSSAAYDLQATNFGFSIPSGATIDGIVGEIERHAADASMIKDNLCGIIKGGTDDGNAFHGFGFLNHTEFWTTSDFFDTFGTSSSLWGNTWTDSDINDSGFGFYIRPGNQVAAATTAYVDFMRLTVYYTPAPDLMPQICL